MWSVCMYVKRTIYVGCIYIYINEKIIYKSLLATNSSKEAGLKQYNQYYIFFPSHDSW
jgi:hypothetical protein